MTDFDDDDFELSDDAFDDLESFVFKENVKVVVKKSQEMNIKAESTQNGSQGRSFMHLVHLLHP